MVLSVIIVHYRVRSFLEQCLHSVNKALRDLEAEILVVDNHSADGSMEFLRPLFPDIKFIVNPENVGFARANNLGLRQASGEYILFLNPDTIVPEDFAQHCLSFLKSPTAPGSPPPIGGLGVRMIDGSGRFLPESRRGFPSPWVAFCKLSGLTRLFPHSRLFSTYYLGFLPANQTHPSPVLSGACLWVSRAILEEVGSFDEDFFMYAEDIDLSYRLEKAGYTNYYFAGTTIIHFKGESTPKDIRYVRQFYKAMSQFRAKHFNRNSPALFRSALEGAIWLRAGLGAIGRIAARPFKITRPSTATRALRHSTRHALPSVRTTWLAGDPEEVNQLQFLLSLTGERKAASDPGQAQEIIFCEGRTFSFKDAIHSLEAAAFYKKGQHAKFHAAGSHSAVGSASRDGRGEVWNL